MTGIIFISQPTFLINLYIKLADPDNTTNLETLNIGGLICAIISMFTWSISVVISRKIKTVPLLQMQLIDSIQFCFCGIPTLMVLTNSGVPQQRYCGYKTVWRIQRESVWEFVYSLHIL